MPYPIFSRSPAAIRVPGVAGFGETPAATRPTPGLPPFRFACDPICALPSNCSALQSIVGKSIVGGINLARNAARRLENNPKDTEKFFRGVFAQGPLDPWDLPGQPAKKEQAGKIVARRFRTVEKELRTRTTLYRCVSASACAQAMSRAREETPHPTDTIVPDLAAFALLCKDENWLCPPFWQLKEEWQAGTILHEMLHLSFGLTCAWFQHDQKEKARNSAYCYEVLALNLAGKVPDQISIDKCKDVLNRNGP